MLRSEKCSTTRWLGRRGKASPPLAALASRRSHFLICARVFIPNVALEDNAEGVVCPSLCVVSISRPPRKRYSRVKDSLR